jgi:competence protein ComFC
MKIRNLKSKIQNPLSLSSLVRETWNGLLDLVYPPKCFLCGRLGEDALCEACRAEFRPVLPPLCARCGMTAAGELCPECAAGTPRYFARARAAGHYDGPLRQAILAHKYEGWRRLAAPLGAYLAEYLQTQPFAPDVPDLIVPVPLHPSRQRERGFNQSGLLAREVGRALCLPVNETELRRIRRTRPQAELRASQRAANIRDAFAVRDPAPFHRKTVLLVDDVLTTCHTVNECARVLVNAGAKKVLVAAVARGG